MTESQKFRHYWLKDHGILRAVWTNFHKLDDDVWRHNHPSPHRLAQLKKMGARSILSLRGAHSIPSQIEAEVCIALGLTFKTLNLRATAAPEKDQLAFLFDAFRTLPKPMVVHCKSGSDRTGLAATLYLHAFHGLPLTEARRQLALRYIHNPWGKAAILAHLLDTYDAAHRTSGISIEEWIRTVYDPGLLASRM